MESALPPPLRGSDDDPFTRDSIQRRLPAIIDEIRTNNPSLAAEAVAALDALRADIVHNRGYAADDDWLTAPWFEVENELYVRILAITGPAGVRDPFLRQKQAAVDAAKESFLTTVAPLFTASSDDDSRDAVLVASIYRSLWGNRADLSLSSGRVDTATADAHAHHDSNLLANDVDAFVAACRAAPPLSIVNIVLDNCGLELLSDLVLAANLLTQRFASSVRLVAKARPVFVSDALIVDVHWHIAAIRDMASTATSEASRTSLTQLHAVLMSPAVTCVEHGMFNTATAMWDMPEDVRALFASPSPAVTIFKGDANYRRLLGDRHWSHSTPFAHVMQLARFPTAVLALRTCKAGLICGISDAAEATATAADPGAWLTSGKYGVIQFAGMK